VLHFAYERNLLTVRSASTRCAPYGGQWWWGRICARHWDATIPAATSSVATVSAVPQRRAHQTAGLASGETGPEALPHKTGDP